MRKIKSAIVYFINAMIISFLSMRPLRQNLISILGRTISAKIFVAKYRRLCINLTTDEMVELTRAVHDRFPNNVTITEKLVGLLVERRKIQKAMDLARTCIEARILKASKKRSARYEDVVSGESIGTVIQISGYFYSGSGAVLDFLKGFKKTIKWGPGAEVRIVKFSGGLGELYDNFREAGRLKRIDLLNLFLHLTASFYITTDEKTYSKKAKVNNASQKMLDSPKAVSYLLELFKLWHRLDEFSLKDEQSEEELVAIIREGIRRSFNAILFTNKSKILLSDQMVTAWKLPYAALLPPCKFIVVHRDPRDQFSEVNQARGTPGRPAWTVSNFISIYLKWRSIADEWIPRLEEECGHSILRLKFEDVITDYNKTSNQIFDFLGLDRENFNTEKSKLDPSVSIKNVGKYHNYLNENEICEIEDKLINYLRSERN